MDEEKMRCAVEELRADVAAADNLDWYWTYHDVQKAGQKQHLIQFLANEPELAEFNEQMRTIGDSASRMTYDDLARWLVERALNVGTEAAVAELCRYLDAQDFECVFLIALAGVSVAQAVELGHGVHLVPYSETEFLMERVDKFPYHFAPTKRISAALIKTIRHPKYKSPLKGDGIPVMGWHVLRRCFGLLRNACLDFPPLIYGDLY